MESKPVLSHDNGSMVIFMQDSMFSYIDRCAKKLVRQHFTDVQGEQPSFSKSIASSFAKYHALQFLVQEHTEGQYLLTNICAKTEW